MSQRLLPPKESFAIGVSLGAPFEWDKHWEGDLELVRTLHLQTLEFETDWARLFPRGRVTVDQKVLDHYDRFVDELLERGITPQIILGEGGLPDDILDRGAFVKRDSIYWFADYSRVLATKLGDRVRSWLTHKDPEAHRPEKVREGWQSMHHRLLSHGFAREAIAAEHQGLDVGFGLKFWPIYPASDRTRDHEAALRLENIVHRYYLDLLFHGAYNEATVHYAQFECGGDVEFLLEGDKHKLKDSADFLRLDYEFLPVISVKDSESYTRSAKLRHKQDPKAEPYTHRRSSERLAESLRKLKAEYQPKKLQIALASPTDPKEENIEGRIEDTPRMLYHTHHLLALKEALDEPMPLTALFWKNLFDAQQKQGLIGIDEHENRTLKDSAYWLRALIETRNPAWESGTDYKAMD